MSVVFRFAEEPDAADMLAIYAPFCEASAVSFEVTAPAVEEMARRIRQVGDRLPWLVCQHEARVAGYVYASPHRERPAYQWAVDVTAYVADGYRGAGIGSSLYRCLFQLLALQGYYKAYAGIALPNPASVRLHESVGFTPVGVYRGVGYKLGRWHDVGWWQLALRPEDAAPPPRCMAEVRELPAAREALRAGAALVRIS
jgi:L-amino acid N-acyltransferase YncA